MPSMESIWSVHPGQILALMGPSGSGKTTLLMVMGCLLHASAGTVRVEGRDIGTLDTAELARLRLARMGFIFQSYNLFPALTALENVQLSLELKGRDLAEGVELLERVGLGERLRNYPKQLSGGEKQRSPSPAPWRVTPLSCWRTSPPPPWTPPMGAPWSSCWATWPTTWGARR
jgi:ABC-type lipoprotein export system ATPase subunit